MIDRQGRGLVDDKYIVGGCGLCTTYRQVGQSINYGWIVGRHRNRVGCYLFISRFLLLFSIDLQERHRQIPDVGRGEQIVCDKQIVGADGLFAQRELRDIFLHRALIYNRVDRADWEDGSTEFWTSDRYSCCKQGL